MKKRASSSSKIKRSTPRPSPSKRRAVQPKRSSQSTFLSRENVVAKVAIEKNPVLHPKVEPIQQKPVIPAVTPVSAEPKVVATPSPISTTALIEHPVETELVAVTQPKSQPQIEPATPVNINKWPVEIPTVKTTPLKMDVPARNTFEDRISLEGRRILLRVSVAIGLMIILGLWAYNFQNNMAATNDLSSDKTMEQFTNNLNTLYNDVNSRLNEFGPPPGAALTSPATNETTSGEPTQTLTPEQIELLKKNVLETNKPVAP